MIAGALLGLGLLGLILIGLALEALGSRRPAAQGRGEAWMVGPQPSAPSSRRRGWTLVLLDGPSAILDFTDGRVVLMNPGAELHVEAGSAPTLRETPASAERRWLSIHAQGDAGLV